MPARTAAPSGDSFALPAEPPARPAPVAPSSASQDFAAGMQAAQAQSEIVIDSLRGMLADTRAQLGEVQQRLRDDRDDHQKALQALETQHRTRLDEMRDKLADERAAAADAKQQLAIEKLRGELTKTGDSSVAERLVDGMLSAAPSLAAAFSAAPGAMPMPAAMPAAAPLYVPPAAEAAPPPPAAADPAEMAHTLLSRFEAGVLAAVTDAIRSHAAGGDVTAGSTAVQNGLKLLSKAGITPPAGIFARIALNAVLTSLNEGQAARDVADALRPVVAVAGQASAFLSSLTPDVAADMLGSLAGVAVPPEMRAFLIEVVGYIARGPEADAPIDAGVIDSAATGRSTASDGAQTTDA